MNHTSDSEITAAALKISHFASEYVAGNSFARISVIDSDIAIRVDEYVDCDHLTIEVDEQQVFVANFVNAQEYEVLFHKADDAWHEVVMGYAADLPEFSWED